MSTIKLHYAKMKPTGKSSEWSYWKSIRRLYCTSVDICEIRWRIKGLMLGGWCGGCVGRISRGWGWAAAGWGERDARVGTRAGDAPAPRVKCRAARTAPLQAACAPRPVNSICPLKTSFWKHTTPFVLDYETNFLLIWVSLSCVGFPIVTTTQVGWTEQIRRQRLVDYNRNISLFVTKWHQKIFRCRY